MARTNVRLAARPRVRELARPAPAWFEHAAVLVLYAGLTLLFTFPMVLHFASATPSTLSIDRDQNLWNFWWVDHALLQEGRNPFRTDLLFYPLLSADGTSLYFHTLGLANALLALPFLHLFGLAAAYNLIVTLTFVVAGYGTYLLVRHLTRHRPAAAVAGMVFAFAPYHLAALKGQLPLLSLHWVPLYVWALLQALEKGSWRYRLLGAGLLALTALSDWQYTLHLVLLSLGASLWAAARALRRGGGAREAAVPIWRTGSIGLIWALALLPVLVPMLREVQGSDYMVPDPAYAELWSADILSFFVPQLRHPVLGSLVAAWRGHGLDPGVRLESYVGVVSLGLALWAAVRCRPRPWPWIALGLGSAVLALGPFLRVNGSGAVLPGGSHLPLPYALTYGVPILNITRAPERFAMLVMLAVAVLVGLALARQLPRASVRIGRLHLPRGLLLFLVAGLIGFEYLFIPYPVEGLDVSPFFRQIAAEPGRFALLDLPITKHYKDDGPRLRDQIVHGRPITGGYISRPVPNPFENWGSVGRWFRDYSLTPDIAGGDARDGALALMRAFDFRYVVLYREDLGPEEGAALAFFDQVLGPGAHTFSDAQIHAYRVPAGPTEIPLLLVGTGWYGVEAQQGQPKRWMHGDTATLEVISPGEIDARLTFDAASFRVPRHLVIQAGTREIARLEVPTEITRFSTPVFHLPPGHSSLQLSVPEGQESPAAYGSTDQRSISIALLDASLQP